MAHGCCSTPLLQSFQFFPSLVSRRDHFPPLIPFISEKILHKHPLLPGTIPGQRQQITCCKTMAGSGVCVWIPSVLQLDRHGVGWSGSWAWVTSVCSNYVGFTLCYAVVSFSTSTLGGWGHCPGPWDAEITRQVKFYSSGCGRQHSKMAIKIPTPAVHDLCNPVPLSVDVDCEYDGTSLERLECGSHAFCVRVAGATPCHPCFEHGGT